MRNAKLYLPAAMLLTIAAVAFAQPPATQPSPQIQRWFDELADADPAARQAARESLMGISRDDLASLRQIVEHNHPLAPAQSAALHDIVVHVYLAHEPYDAMANSGLLGVMLDPLHQPAAVAPQDWRNVDPGSPAVQGISGVVIKERWPGFCGYRYLQERDVVLGVVETGLIATPDIPRLQQEVGRMRAGETVTLQVLRNGRMMRIALKLDPRPRELESGQLLDSSEFIQPRSELAEQYWKQAFEPLLKRPLS